MRDYRVLELRPDGQVTSKFDFSAPDDEVAKERAREAASGQDLELWRNDRKISEWRARGRLGLRSGGYLTAVDAMYTTKDRPERSVTSRL
jgi:hypothetical protein